MRPQFIDKSSACGYIITTLGLAIPNLGTGILNVRNSKVLDTGAGSNNYCEQFVQEVPLISFSSYCKLRG